MEHTAGCVESILTFKRHPDRLVYACSLLSYNATSVRYLGRFVIKIIYHWDPVCVDFLYKTKWKNVAKRYWSILFHDVGIIAPLYRGREVGAIPSSR